MTVIEQGGRKPLGSLQWCCDDSVIMWSGSIAAIYLVQSWQCSDSSLISWTAYTYWPVSLLLTSGGLLPAAWNAHDKRQTPDTNCSITKSRKSFMRTVTPLDSSASSSSRLRLWKDSLTDVPASVKMGLEVADSLPAGSREEWLCWRALNRLWTRVGRAKTVMRRWGNLDAAHLVDCDCGEPQTMAHLLSCRLLDEACKADDLATGTERAKTCARKWEKIV